MAGTNRSASVVLFSERAKARESGLSSQDASAERDSGKLKAGEKRTRDGIYSRGFKREQRS